MIAVVVLALGAAVLVGVSDFYGGVAARRIHLVTMTLFDYVVALVTIGVVLLIVGGAWSASAILWGTVCGVLAAFGLLAFYGVMAIGPMSLLSPLIALIESVVPVAAAVITGQPLTLLSWVAIAVGILAMVLLAPRPEPGRTHLTPRGAFFAVASGLLLGLSIVALDFAPHDSGVVPSVLDIGVGTIVLGVVWLVLRLVPDRRNVLAFLRPDPDAPDTLSAPRAWIAAAISGVVGAVADAFIVVDLHIGNLAVVSVLAGLYPVVTVILAATILKERMTRLQVVAVVLVIAASLMFSAAG